MNEKQRRLLEIGSNLMSWDLDFVRVLGRVGEVEKMSSVSDLDKKEIIAAADRLRKLFAEAIRVNESQPTATEVIDHLFASYDRLCEERAKLNQNLDRILK